MNIGSSGNIFIERAHPAYDQVIDFLVSCCEPVSRTQHVEQYRMDSSSLSAATAEGTYTLDMIETILRHYRLNDRQELAVDVERCAALWQLATALEESDANLEDFESAAASPSAVATSRSGAGTTASTSSWAARAAAHIPLPPSLRNLDFSNTSLAQFYPAQKAALPVSAGTPAPTLSLRLVKAEKAEDESAKKKPASTGRVLQLFRPASPPATKSAASSSSTSPPPPTAASSLKPLISLAVVRPEDVEQPLPESIAKMLSEEENASRVQIVLQPRLRRFHQFDASNGKSLSQPSTRNGGSTAAQGGSSAADEELFYFIESRQRAHLELVLEELKEFLEPVLLYGKERWILSDVDRSPPSAAAAGSPARSAGHAAGDAGRPAVLRMLYESPSDRSGGRRRGASDAAAPLSRFIFKCQVRDGKLREVKERLFSRFNIRADCYYDYQQDRTLHVPRLNLASHVRLRPYQVASLERFRRGSKAHQGVVVLPCGAGKTLTGIGAAASMQKTTIVMCVNNMSVFQWQREFLRWTDLTEEEVTVCTAKVKQMPGKVFITTYNMVIAKRGSSDGAAAEESRAILKAMTSQAWGLLLLDEVHTALAHHFQDVLNTIKYKCVLGLSATLLREDDKIGDLRHLVGPKLYEANWLDLTRAGFLASVECAEVQCPMPLAFLKEYRDVQRARLLLGANKTVVGRGRRRARQEESVFEVDGDADGDAPGGGRSRQRGRHSTTMGLNSRALHLASCNPYKLWCTQALLAFHRQRSPPDKVIIFCDYLADVRFFAHHLHLPFMDQRTSEAERTNLLQYFQHSPDVNAIILTRVGDVALDLPCASVIIQVSGLGASRRQEAQRLGRILRPKPPSLDNTCAYFYTLVSQDTGDIRTSYKRQSWLRDQGFAYRILHCDRVLDEFLRVGGQPCCVGPPQWWYQSTAPSPAINTNSTRGEMRSAAAAAGLVAYDGVYWVPFSLVAATKMERAFQQGRGTCVLTDSDLGSTTPRPPAAELGHYPLRATESWEVTFSSTDAPQTFGTVRIGEGSIDSATVQQRVRRVRRGCLDRSHQCSRVSGGQDGDCISHALRTVLGVHGGGGVGAEETSQSAEGMNNDEFSSDDDLPMDDF